jgi:ribosome-binding protein aMBF1 (putative translation factor)
MNNEFAEFVINMRTSIGWSRADLAHHMCLSASTAEAFETGTKLPTNPVKFEKYLREIVKTEIRKQRRYYTQLRYDTAV